MTQFRPVLTLVDGSHGGPTDRAAETEAWLEALRTIAQSYHLPLSEQAARQFALWSDDSAPIKDRLGHMARRVGLELDFHLPAKADLSPWRLPVILQMHNGRTGVVTALSAQGQAAVRFSGEGGAESQLSLETLLQAASLVAFPRPLRSIPDARVDAYIQPWQPHWLRRILFRDLRPYVHVMLASLVANLLGLASVLFSMQVYDRVVPAQSFNTLYVLFAGVVLAIVFDFMSRRLRSDIIDILGKRADLRLSDQVFGHALRVKNKARPSSTGSFIAQLRDMDQVRELLTSTSVSAVADMPFFLLFLGVFWYMGGGLVAIPLIGFLAMMTPGLLAQGKLRRYAKEGMREASLRNALLVEAVQGVEDIKALQAEERFQQQWNHLNAVTGEAQLRQRALTGTLALWTQNVQTGVYVTTILVGAPMVIAGDMTTGALVGVSILGSRMMGPMAQMITVLGRFQQARVGMQGLNGLMQLPVDHPPEESRVHRSKVAGRYRLRGALFRYGDDSSPPALMVRNLEIEPGERIAILGRNGAGKSTLLQALSGMLEASEGDVVLDDVAVRHIDPADLRRDVAMLTQNARLFYGSLRENITLGAPKATDSDIMEVLELVGADGFVRRLPRGLEHLVLEGGRGMSGGQKQALLLARLLIRRPSVLLLDEPTASMDETTERQFIERFAAWSKGCTVVVATHRMRVLELVDRLLVVEGGQIALDDTKGKALRTLRRQAPGTRAAGEA